MSVRIGLIVLSLGAFIFSSCGNSDEIPAATLENGKKAYLAYCQSCHMEDGSGVPGLNAPLIESKYASGDKKKLIEIALQGSAAFANDPERPYKNLMPSMANLTDTQIADALTYIRNNFKNKGSVVTPEEVRSEREKSN